MNLETFYEYCLSKKGASEHFPFDDVTLVFKVGGKMFALSSLLQWEKNEPSVNLKCDPGALWNNKRQAHAPNAVLHKRDSA